MNALPLYTPSRTYGLCLLRSGSASTTPYMAIHRLTTCIAHSLQRDRPCIMPLMFREAVHRLASTQMTPFLSMVGLFRSLRGHLVAPGAFFRVQRRPLVCASISILRCPFMKRDALASASTAPARLSFSSRWRLSARSHGRTPGPSQ